MATDPNSALFALLAQLTGNAGAYQQQTGPGYSYGYPQGYSPYGYQGVPSGYNQQPYGYNPYSQGYSPYYQPYQQPPPNQNTQSAPPWMGSVGVPAVGTQPSSAPAPGSQGNAPAQDPNAYINSLIATLTGNQQPAYGNASTGPSQGSTWNYGITSADPGGNPGPIALRGGAPDAGQIGNLNFSSPTPAPIPGTGAAGPSSIAGLYGTDGTTPAAPGASSTSSSSSGGNFNAADPWGSVSNRKPELNSSWSGLWGG